MKSREIFDLHWKLDQLSQLSSDVQMMLSDRPDLHEKFGKMADYSRKLSSYIRTREELPPIPARPGDVVVAFAKPVRKLLK
jgi:hypothetical protein